MAFNFSPGGVYNPRPLDFSELANIPDAFWKGQDRGALGTAREEVSAALKNGDMQGAAAALAKLDPTKAYAVAGDTGNDRYGMQFAFDEYGNAYQPYSGGGVRPVTGEGGSRLIQPGTWVQTPQGVSWQPKNKAVGSGVPPSQGGGVTHPVYGSQEEADAAAPQDGGGGVYEGDPNSAPATAAPAPGTSYLPKNYATPETQKVGAEISEKTRKAIPAAEGMTRRVISAIEQVEKNPNLKNVIGTIQGRMPTFGEKNTDVEEYIAQVIGGTFTSVYESLRGAQAITDVEGAKATAAITRLQNLKQSEAGYRRALSDAKYEVFDLVNVMRSKANLPLEENPYEKPGTSSGEARRTKTGVQWSIER
jgi:hypothetical protein